MTVQQLTSSTNTAVRSPWDALPAALRSGIAGLLGRIESADVQGGGFTPGLAARLRLADGWRLFVKGIPVEHVLADKYRTEAATARALPETTPAPRLRWDGEIAGWVVLVSDDVDGRHADLSPGSPDVGLVVSTVSGLNDALTPCPAPAPLAGEELAEIVHGWRELAAAPPADLGAWALQHLDDLADLETGWLAAADGDTLLHGDINASNLLITDGRVWLIDWAQPVRGAAWIDVADLVPHLVLAGHTPAEAESVVQASPVWRATDPDVITSYAAAFAGYWARSCRYPAPPSVPHLRAYQRRAAQAACAWAAHRMGWLS
jgi:hypothetical protein